MPWSTNLRCVLLVLLMVSSCRGCGSLLTLLCGSDIFLFLPYVSETCSHIKLAFPSSTFVPNTIYISSLKHHRKMKTFSYPLSFALLAFTSIPGVYSIPLDTNLSERQSGTICAPGRQVAETATEVAVMDVYLHLIIHCRF